MDYRALLMGYFTFLVKKRDLYSIKTALNFINVLLVDILCVYSALLMDYKALLMGFLTVLVHFDACSNESCHT